MLKTPVGKAYSVRQKQISVPLKLSVYKRRKKQTNKFYVLNSTLKKDKHVTYVHIFLQIYPISTGNNTL